MKTSMLRVGAILLALSLCLTVVQPMQVNAAEGQITVNVKNSGATIIKGNQVKLTASLKNAKMEKATFKSEIRDVATVDSSGKVTGKKAGTAKIEVTVTATDGQIYKKTVKVYVKNEKAKQTPYIELSVHKTIAKGNKATVKCSLKRSGSKIQKITYKSSNSRIATVNGNGVITAKKAGTVNIIVTAMTQDGYTSKATQKITVPKKILTRSGGVNYYNGNKETWYTQRMFPGQGLIIPGRHIRNDGVICDKNGYVVVALSSGRKGQIVETSRGTGKCYDTNPSNSIDIYTNW